MSAPELPPGCASIQPLQILLPAATLEIQGMDGRSVPWCRLPSSVLGPVLRRAWWHRYSSRRSAGRLIRDGDLLWLCCPQDPVRLVQGP